MAARSEAVSSGVSLAGADKLRARRFLISSNRIGSREITWTKSALSAVSD